MKEGFPPPQEPAGELDPVELEKEREREKKELQRQEWRRMMQESRVKQESLQKAEEIKNAARKARNRKQRKVDQGLCGGGQEEKEHRGYWTGQRHVWRKEEELHGR